MTLKGFMLPVFLLFIIAAALASGCQTAKTAQGPEGPPDDEREALTAVAGAITGKPLSEEEKKELERQIRTDKEARSAIEAITGSVGGRAVVVKFCPVCGKHYAAHIEICPDDGARLEIVE